MCPPRVSQEERLDIIRALTTFTVNSPRISPKTTVEAANSEGKIKAKADSFSTEKANQPRAEAKHVEAQKQTNMAAEARKSAEATTNDTQLNECATPTAAASAASIPPEVAHDESAGKHKEVNKEKQVLRLLVRHSIIRVVPIGIGRW